MDFHLSEGASEVPNNLIEVHLTVNKSISYRLIYENEHDEKSFIQIKALNETFMKIEGSEGYKKVI